MKNKTKEIAKRLEYLRGEIKKGCISYGEIAELQELIPYIDDRDTLLLEWANVPEFPVCKKCWNKVSRRKVSEEYSYYCPNCDEDLYSFEVAKEEDKNILIGKISDIVENWKIVNNDTEALQNISDLLEESKEEPTKVKFVVFKGEIVALFPEIIEGENMILSYAHIGQHSTAHKDLLKCKRATFTQYKDLANELENLVGYNLVII